MPFDFKKAYPALYSAKPVPAIIEVPDIRYLSRRGRGDPNEPDGCFQQAIRQLYTLSYTLRMSDRAGYPIEGFAPYVVPPLEGFWWQEGVQGVDYARRKDFEWVCVLRLPDFILPEHLSWAKAEALRKKKMDCTQVQLLQLAEGLCAQVLHLGPYTAEPETVGRMHAWLEQNGYRPDITEQRHHHEIYLSDFRRVAPEKLRTIIRHPVKRLDI